MDEIQPILDKSCVSCHNNKKLTIIGDQVLEVDMTNAKPILPIGSVWKYSTSGIQPVDWNKASFNDSCGCGTAPFGKSGTPLESEPEWTSSKIYLRKEFNITQQQLNSNTFIINIAYDENQ